MMLITVLLTSMCNSSPMMVAINGVATLKVVAVPAKSANTASKSISLPIQPSVCFPNIERHASEYFCLFRFRTWSMNPKATANTK